MAKTCVTMQIHLLSIKPLRHSGLQQHRRKASSRHHLAAFSLCIVLIIQQSVALPQPRQTPVAAASSLALISLPQLNNSDASSSSMQTTVLTPGQMVINAIPKPDRAKFFVYQLAVGLHNADSMRNKTQWLSNLEDVINYTEQQVPDFKDVPIYENFAMDLLQWLMEKFNLSPEDVYNRLRSRSGLFCTATGVCFTPGDTVCFCCPF